MRAPLLLSCSALLAFAGCIEEPRPVVPVGSVTDGEPYEPDETLAAVSMAAAEIEGLDGSGVSGTVTFTQLTDDQLRVEYTIRGLEPGPHGFHVHESGSCGPGPDGTPGGAAGGHFNPEGHPHGGPEAMGSARHVGDFGNIVATERGVASGTFTDDVARLSGPHPIVGQALIVHGDADDLQSQPSGAAGARVGCGIIVDVETSDLP